MGVANGEITLARTGIETLKYELAGSWNIEQGEVFRGRSDEDQVIILGIVEREKSPPLHAQRTIQQVEDAVELVNGQNLPNSGVVVEDKSAGVGGGVEVAHAGFRATHETAVAEDHPGLLQARSEATPEKLIGGRDRLCSCGLCASALR